MEQDATLFDTHAHLDDPQLVDQVEQVVQAAGEQGVRYILAVATTLASSQRCVRLAESHSGVFASVGIHPNCAHEAGHSDWSVVEQLCQHPRVVALGESGLDGYWDDCPMDLQREYFARHIHLSHETGLPFIVHMRECEQKLLEHLAISTRDGLLNGIMHSFTGSAETAAQCLEWGMYISFAGMVTYKKNHALREIAASIPEDRILIETDAPYLSPHPRRSQRPNEPSLVRYTLACLAEARGTTYSHLARRTTANALRVFGLASKGDD